MRYLFGPSQSGFVVEGDDVIISLDSIVKDLATGVVVVGVTVPPVDSTSPRGLRKVFAVFAPDAPSSTDDPQEYLNAPGRYVGGVDVIADGKAHALTIPVRGVPGGSWFVQTVLEFES